MTIARPIPDFPGYEVTDDGRVLSTRPWRGSSAPRELRGGVGKRGYRLVVLCDGQHRRTREVHCLVAEAFHGPRPEGTVIRHLDGDNQNNASWNLRYGTYSENELDKVRHGTHQNARKTHCPAGHPYSDENTYVTPSTGDRTCRACARARRGGRAA